MLRLARDEWSRIESDYQFKNPVLCFPGQLNQVFMNIINNAHDAMHGKGTLFISVYADNENVVIAFRDTGPGIPDDMLPKIFDPGFTTKGVGVGTGLGLSICYRIIREHHKGIITAENHEKHGAILTINIPMKGKDNNSKEEGMS